LLSILGDGAVEATMIVAEMTMITAKNETLAAELTMLAAKN